MAEKVAYAEETTLTKRLKLVIELLDREMAQGISAMVLGPLRARVA